MPAVNKKLRNKNKIIVVKKEEEENDDSVSSTDEKIDLISTQLKKKVKNEKTKKKENKEAKGYKTTRGVVYVSHLPHGFYENEMMGYFKQFGNVTRVRVARSDKTARCKGYAFVEFEVPEVAEIAAQAMNNYIMFNQVLKTQYIPPQEQKYNLFRTGVRIVKRNGETIFLTPHSKRIKKAIDIHNRVKTTEELERIEKRYKNKVKKFNEKLETLGINGNMNEVFHNANNSKSDSSIKDELTKKKKIKQKQTKSNSKTDTLKENTNLIKVGSEVLQKNKSNSQKDKKKILKPKNINSNEKIENKKELISNDGSAIKEKKKNKKTKKNLIKIVSSEEEKSPISKKKASKAFKQIDTVEDRQTTMLKQKKQFGGIEKKGKKNDNKALKNNKMKFAAAALMQNAEAKTKIIKSAVNLKTKGKKKVV